MLNFVAILFSLGKVYSGDQIQLNRWWFFSAQNVN